jgi:predicted amidophosphoribosyltransferase
MNRLICPWCKSKIQDKAHVCPVCLNHIVWRKCGFFRAFGNAVAYGLFFPVFGFFLYFLIVWHIEKYPYKAGY